MSNVVNLETVVASHEVAFPECDIKVETSTAINKPGKIISIKPKDSNIGAILYWERIRPQLEDNGGDMTSVIQTARRGINQTPTNFDAEWITDYENVKNNLVVCVCSSATNNLVDMPHHVIAGDLCEYYRIVVKDFICSPDSEASIRISNKLLVTWGISEEQLRDDAIKSSQILHPICIENMADAFAKILGYAPMEADVPLWVASNCSRLNGASVVAYPGFFEEVRKIVGNSCYLMPASVHEVILAPPTAITPDVNFMTQMVREINAVEVKPKDRLSDNVFYVDIDKETITLAI